MATLRELCTHIQHCTEKLETEIKDNIQECHASLLRNQATEVTLSLEKAKDYHYKEILNFLREILSNVKSIISHEEKIRRLGDEKNFTQEELKRYSHVQRQISAFSNSAEYVVKREKRRVASEISMESLEAWEKYMDQKVEEDTNEQVEKKTVAKRRGNNRKKKKFVSSTFNNFLEERKSTKLDSIVEDSSATEDEIKTGKTPDDQNVNERLNDENKEINEHFDEALAQTIGYNDVKESSQKEAKSRDKNIDDKYTVKNIMERIEDELFLSECNDTKPKIVDVVYKKK